MGQNDIKNECNCACGGECGGECQCGHCECGHCHCEDEAEAKPKNEFYPDLPRMMWDADDFADWD